MTTITLEVSDDLALRIDPLRNHLPHLLEEIVVPGSWNLIPRAHKSGASHPAYQEMIDFLSSGSTPEQIIAHHPTESVQDRLAELLEKNREEGLTEAETAELELYEQIDDLMSMLKARAHVAQS
jgi:hypothetical protein